MDIKSRAQKVIYDMTFFIQKEFELPHFRISTRLSTSDRRTRSWGGIRRASIFDEPSGYVSIQLRRYDERVRGPISTYRDYRQIANLKTIGDFEGPSFLCTTATIAHEMAHAVDHYCRIKGRELEFMPAHAGSFVAGAEFKGHSKTWMYIYHVLREKYVNPYIPVPNVELAPPPSRTPIVNTPIIKPIPKFVHRYPGRTNIDMVCNMVYMNRAQSAEWLLEEILRMLPTITRSNARIYLKKAFERHARSTFFG